MNWNEYRNEILSKLDYGAYYNSVLKGIQARGSEIKAECPFADELHDDSVDKNPSLTVNLTKGVYYCQTCQSKGNVHTLHRHLNKLGATEAWYQLGDGLKIDRPNSTRPTRPDVEVGLVSEYHTNLMELQGPLREVLRDMRGYTDDTLHRFQLGWDGDRITIPIYDEFNHLVNFRRYKWNSDEGLYKVINYTDELGNAYGEVRIFGIENLVNEEVKDIIWCEGETDRILAEQHGFATACPTSGAGAWRPEWSKLFVNKHRVYLAQDNDKAGEHATQKIAEKLKNVTEVYIIQWPEDFPEKGDITDFFIKAKQTTEDFQALLDGARRYDGGSIDDLPEEDKQAVEVHLADSAAAKLYGKRIKVPVMISGKDTTPYLCPKVVRGYCGDNVDNDNKRCAHCGLAVYAGERRVVMDSKNPDVLKLIKCSETVRDGVLKDIMEINKQCPIVQLDIEEYMNIEELRLIPKAESNFGFSKEHEYVVRTGYSIGDNVKTNERYALAGYMYPDPYSQSATYLFDTNYPEKSLISDFEMTEDILEELKTFRVAEGQTVDAKMNEIHKDFERNVTYVWDRRDVAIAVDLIYHTALNFYFQEQFIRRGWGELLIIGDSGQAKTTLVERMMRHYKLGELHSGESSRRTGLVYSLQQNNGRWFLVWGAYPLNDGGLITIDELSGLSQDDLGQMSDVRSSGIASTTGVITAETTARTRAIYISNPRNGRQLNAETYGAEAILKLFGKAEDVRRLDVAVAVASGDVNPELVNRNISDVNAVPHKYTSELCNRRVQWAWSRKPENIEFTDEAVTTILDEATTMGKMYSSRVPLVEAADQRIKIARLAISTAMCVFNTDETGEKVIVEKDHVMFVTSFLHRTYSAKGMGYDKLSEQDIVTSDSSDKNLQDLRSKLATLPFNQPNDIVEALYKLPYFNRPSLEDYTGLPRDDLRILLKFLTTNSLVERVRGDYRRMPLCTDLLEYCLEKPYTDKEVSELRTSYFKTEY